MIVDNFNVRGVAVPQATHNRFLEDHNTHSKPFEWVADPIAIIANVRPAPNVSFDPLAIEEARRRWPRAEAAAWIEAARDSATLTSWALECIEGPYLSAAQGMVSSKMDATSTLQEVILVEHLQPALPLTVLDAADWAREFSEFGEARQLPWLPPIDLAQPVQIGFSVTGQEIPRLLLRSIDEKRHVQLQADRFAFGWTRAVPVGETESYPGYEDLKSEQVRYGRKFREWCTKRFGISPRTRLAELAYNNAAPIVQDGQRRRIGDIFRWVQPIRSVSAFQVSWVELLELGRIAGPRVNGLVAVGSAPPVSEALLFNFTGLSPVESDDAIATLGAWDALHERILSMYESVIVKSIG